MQTKFKTLRSMIESGDLTFLMEAHNGLSAKIVEETGFQGIWASGLSISSALGVRDRNEASWTQILEVVEHMSDITNVPILMDGDTGFGDFNNVSRLVRKMCQRHIAGVCIEDKMFPKQNSFLGERQPLIPVEDFNAKIKAAKDAQLDPDFVFVARLEALISGHSLQEALDRAHAYREAGADAILVHSKKSDVSEVAEFCQAWTEDCPLVVVPTKYYKTPVNVFRDLGISTVIWANHNMRAAVTAMSDICQSIYDSQSLVEAESRVAPLERVFNLSGETEFSAYEKQLFEKSL
ncbi:MAG: phosphoenolpyruvate mutase [Pseudophaeobacter sp.]|uniref:phosphoenolpyruvate mutase n=1 Tax=Pseudophaeobacter sp. TaxID=1971739 RepID=UPI00329A5A24